MQLARSAAEHAPSPDRAQLMPNAQPFERAGAGLGEVVQVEQTGSHQARFSIVRITPDTAAGFLARKHPGGRRNKNAVSSYAQAMRNGEWALNGMPIIM